MFVEVVEMMMYWSQGDDVVWIVVWIRWIGFVACGRLVWLVDWLPADLVGE